MSLKSRQHEAFLRRRIASPPSHSRHWVSRISAYATTTAKRTTKLATLTRRKNATIRYLIITCFLVISTSDSSLAQPCFTINAYQDAASFISFLYCAKLRRSAHGRQDRASIIFILMRARARLLRSRYHFRMTSSLTPSLSHDSAHE